MQETTPFLKRWLATLMTIPLSVLFFIVGLLSTGAGHGTTLILKLFYAPFWVLRDANFPGGLWFWALLCCSGPIGYAALADIGKYSPKGIILFAGLLLLHYGVFWFWVQDADEQALFAKSYEVYPGLLIFAIALFVVWQVILLTMMILQRRSVLFGKNV